MAKEREYDPAVREEIMVQLRLNRGNVLRTAQETGIPRGTIRYWAGQERRRQAAEVTGHMQRAAQRASEADDGAISARPDTRDADAAFASAQETSSVVPVEDGALGHRNDGAHAAAGGPATRGELVEAAAKRIAGRLHAVRDLYTEWLLNPDVLAETSAKDAAVIVGITTDKIQLLEGRPTARTEHRVVRYVEPGALRDLASKARVIEVKPVRSAAQLAAGEPRESDKRRADEHAEVAATA